MAKRKIDKSHYQLIFNLHAEGCRNKDIAEKFKVNPSCISKILHTKFRIKTDRSGEKNPNSKLTAQETEKIAMYRKKGYTYGTIAVIFGVERTTCSRIVNKKRWINV